MRLGKPISAAAARRSPAVAVVFEQLEGRAFLCSDFHLGGVEPVASAVTTFDLSAAATAAAAAAEPAAAEAMSGDDVNTSVAGGTTVITSGWSYDLTAGGVNIGGTADGFRFVHRAQTGDFDLKVRVASVSAAQRIAKAGLMARADLAPGSRNVFAGVTVGDGQRFTARVVDGGITVARKTPDVPAGTNAWVRLRRVGNVFTAFASADGVTWTPTASQTVALPGTVLVGMAAAAGSATDTTFAQFREYGTVGVTGPAPTPISGIEWSTVAPNPVARAEAHSIVVDDKLYVFSGFTTPDFIPRSKRSDVFDPATDKWTRIADAPVAMTHVGMASDGGVIYIAGGVIGTDEGEKLGAVRNVWTYDTATDTWDDFVPLPAARGAGAMVRLGRELHYFGGTGTDREISKGDHYVLNLDDAEPAWTTSAPMPNPRNHLAGVTVGGKIYAVGGQLGHNATQDTQSDVHVWDPASPGKWTKVKSLPVSISHQGGATFEARGRIIMIAGEHANRDARDTVLEYDPATNAWRELNSSLPKELHSGVAGLIGDAIYYTTGSSNSSAFQTATYKGILD